MVTLKWKYKNDDKVYVHMYEYYELDKCNKLIREIRLSDDRELVELIDKEYDYRSKYFI